MRICPELLSHTSPLEWWWLPLVFALLAGGGVYLYYLPHLRSLREMNVDLRHKMEDRAKVVVQQKEVIQHKIRSLEKAYSDFKVMSKIGQELTTSLELEKVFDKLYEQVNLLMDAAVFGVHLYDEPGQIIHYKYVLENGERQPSVEIPLGHPTLSAYCIRNREELFIANLAKEYRRYLPSAQPVTGQLPSSVLYMPLILQNDVLGAITVQSFTQNAYSQEHVSVLRVLASYTAIAIGNANAFERLEAARASIHQQHEEIIEKNTSLTLAYEIIERHNEAILDSLAYARRIQEAIMPSHKEVSRVLPNSFIYYKPKDIVSGDFFWYMTKGNVAMLAAVDCTGHGVPGAFMSVLGSTLLNQIVHQEGHTSPEIVLTQLDKRVMTMLKQMDPDADATDGMDVSLVTLNLGTREIQFAGANRPLFYMHKGEMHELKGNKYPVGGKYNVHDPYVGHTVPLQPGDSFYIFTDGFADQFGGNRRRKFLNKRFMQLLADISRLPLDKQHPALNEAFETWRGDEKQLDDVLVVGVQV
ncbi:MAG: SpoIIE family protein phosphatase [Bacteroidetes bacterium]|nr:SpoIIE family protein phosphatase [Bacteroidota bacterium]